jgi:hypothetical protein
MQDYVLRLLVSSYINYDITDDPYYTAPGYFDSSIRLR